VKYKLRQLLFILESFLWLLQIHRNGVDRCVALWNPDGVPAGLILSLLDVGICGPCEGAAAWGAARLHGAYSHPGSHGTAWA
jgi:hypothetical protein